jgi:hypothetical protein
MPFLLAYLLAVGLLLIWPAIALWPLHFMS